MKSKLNKFWWRIKILVTGKIVWSFGDGYERVEYNRALAWRLAGIHNHNWKWVRKYGKMDCGCTRNPLTRKVVLFLMNCSGGHCDIDLSDIEEESS